MKATVKLIAVGIAGLSLAACGSNALTSSSGTTSTTRATSAKSSVSTTTTSTTVPANAPVGFNAARTEFVLPHNMGLLPVSELTLAKSDPEYAAGLASPNDWDGIDMSAVTGSSVENLVWYYGGLEDSVAAAIMKSSVTVWPSPLPTLNKPNGLKISHSTSVDIRVSKLNAFTVGEVAVGVRIPRSDQLITASSLEIEAAPVGTLTVNGSNILAYCVPTPEAWIASGKVVNVTGLPTRTAGPSTVFAQPAGMGNLQGSPPARGSVFLYDKGVTSCANFS